MSDPAEVAAATPEPLKSNLEGEDDAINAMKEKVQTEMAAKSAGNGNGEAAAAAVNGSSANGDSGESSKDEEDGETAEADDNDSQENGNGHSHETDEAEAKGDPLENGVEKEASRVAAAAAATDDDATRDSDVQMLSSDVASPEPSPLPSTSKPARDVEEVGASEGSLGEEESEAVDEDEEMEEIGDEEDDDEVEEVKDTSSDSDVMEIVEGDRKKEAGKSVNVVTIDNMDALRSLADDAKKKQESAAAGAAAAAKSAGGVTITPTGGGGGTPTSSRPGFPSGTLPPGLTISQTGNGKSNRSSPVVSQPVSQKLNDPNLTDDTFVVEAPSFIVPYVYEKPPRETIGDFKKSIAKIAEEKKKEAEEKDEKKGEEKKEDSGDDSDEKEKKSEEEKPKEGEEEKKKPQTFFESVLGKFIMDLGMNLVQETVQVDLLKEQQRRSHKDKSAAVMHAIMSLKKNIESSKEVNKEFTYETKKCRFCSFKTESETALAHHLETPHLTKLNYFRCNLCKFEHKVANDVLAHMFLEHGVRGRIERQPALHQCPQCPYEDHMKGKLTRHKVGCDKRFRPERNQDPPHDWEPPAKIPKPVQPRGRAMPNSAAMASSFMAGKTGNVVGMNHIQQFQQQHQRKQVFPNSAGGGGGGIPNMPQLQYGPRGRAAVRPTGFLQKPSTGLGRFNNQVVMQPARQGSSLLLPNLGSNSSVTIQSIGQRNNSKSAQPSISITPLSGRGGRGGQGQSPAAMKPGQPGAAAKGGFVICEICDGYIKDLEQLRNHMQWIHKVKIHPKMIYNRPPLNCQKCQFRFFTDQGLERHLLGSHGLVTASMQDLANKSQDSGRCPVCGKVYQWKLLNHVAKDHMKVLKPAHLSYKCTVCTATFGQYKLFENHVYTAHSGGNRKSIGRQPPSSQPSNAAASSSAAASPVAAAAAAAGAKAAIKVSDEITIIPQKASSSSSTTNSKPSSPAAATLSKLNKTNDPDVIELDDDEEEIDDEMKESNEGASAGEKRASSASGEGSSKRQKGAEEQPSESKNGPKAAAATVAKADSDDEGVEEIHDEEMDDE